MNLICDFLKYLIPLCELHSHSKRRNRQVVGRYAKEVALGYTQNSCKNRIRIPIIFKQAAQRQRRWLFVNFCYCLTKVYQKIAVCKGKFFSEALIFASTNPQYDKILFMELPVQYMKIQSSEHGENMIRTCCVLTQIVFCFCFEIQNNLCTQHVLNMF